MPSHRAIGMAERAFRSDAVADELFLDVQQRLEQKIERLEVSYDPTYGYPRSIVADIALRTADDEYALTAGNLRRLP